MKVSNSRSPCAKFFLYAVVLVSLALSTSAHFESVILQPVEALSSSGDEGELSWGPPKPRCDASQPSFDVKCYAKRMNESLGCESDLGGVGSLDTLCRVRSSITLGQSSIIVGAGTLEIAHHVNVSCARPGCEIILLLKGNLTVGSDSSISGGTLTIQAANIRVEDRSSINSTALAGTPPPGTSGTPSNFEGAGGGHGGRGASCERNEGKDQGDVWGGDMYEWETLAEPWSHGSRGGTTVEEKFYLGGAGGGRIAISTGELLINGSIEADGGTVGDKGGGGSGGSIVIKALTIEGKDGRISASGGTGRGGGGGGRVKLDYKQLEGVGIFYHGGDSLGCPQNAGAAGTLFDVMFQSLIVSNNNKKSKTDTVLLAFTVPPLWGSVVIKESARIGIPLQWSTIRVTGQVKLMSGSVLIFGLAESSSSELELMATDFVMENSTLLVYGALRLSAKMLSMTSSHIDIIASQEKLMVVTSTIEGSNLAYIQGSSAIRSNANLAIYGQGLLQLEGPGDTIMAQRLFVSLFYNVIVGSGAILRAPVEADSPIQEQITSMYCESHQCPTEVLRPSEDCTLNITSPFTLQICRVEDVDIHGEVSGSVVHIQRARNVTITREGILSASGLGCPEGLGVGNVTSGGAGGGGGHGGIGGKGILGDLKSEGGGSYGNSELPCELGSGGGNPGSGNSTSGGGLIVLGSMYHPVTVLDVYGVLAADGESSARVDFSTKLGGQVGGSGGGSGGSLLLFLQTMILANGSLLSTTGGRGGAVGGGGGAGGRVHFHWSDIPTGEDYVPIATVEGHISISGGDGNNDGLRGDNGNVSGKQCPRGLYGTYCVECPVGTYKNETGSAKELCRECPPLPGRAEHTYVRGGVSKPMCPYQCISDKYRMPHCYTVLEDLIYTLGGPYLFVLFLSCVMVVLALMLSVARMKLVGNDDFSRPAMTPRVGLHVEQSFPFLESLNEVLETTRVEESQCHIHRMYFMGSNSFNEPWHLPHSPPDQIVDFVYEDAFNRFVEEVNGLAAYQWWEGSVHSILTVLAYPFAWSWQQWRRREKLQRLQEFVHSEYDHACLRSCRSRALYEGLKVAAGPDLILAYIDVFLGGDEKRPDLPPKLMERVPMSIIFGGNGTYLSSYNLHSDNLLTSLLSQAVPATMWYRLVAGLNAQLRTVRKGALCTSLMPVISWLDTHANPWLFEQGVRIDLAWCQATASGYYQLGLLLNHADDIPQYFQPASMLSMPRSPGSGRLGSFGHLEEGMFRRPQSWHLSPSYSSLGSRRRIGGATLDTVSVRSLEDKHYPIFPLSFLLRNTRPVGQQASVGLAISLLILADLSLTLLMLLQFYSVGIEAVLLIVLFLPLASVLPSAAGLNALFSHGSRRSAGLARVYALWNVTSLVNVLVALVIGFLHYNMGLGLHTTSVHPKHMSSEEDTWWILPALLVLIKCVQARTIDLHVANLEIQDRSLYASDPIKFWEP
ncbi:hypothetical protein M758_10G110100 [Ceratodon purpureus]|nr:hypothetical protein M758_10G110100 [Ceratodon purpureus]